MITIEEHVPPHLAHRKSGRRESVDDHNDALTVNWIAKLPGIKRIEYLKGREVVVQYYLGLKVFRAYIYSSSGPSAGVVLEASSEAEQGA